MKRQPWKRLESRDILHTRLFRLRSDRLELPDGRVMPSYYVMEMLDWVNVIPVTKQREIVLIEQYRNATGAYTIEIPGGAIDSKNGESNEQAAVRELTEETGYTVGRIESLGRQAPNPALQSNIVETFIAFDCELTQSQNLDPFEDIRVLTKSIPETYAMIARGEINHSLIVAAFVYALPFFGIDLSTLR
jgi:8-oxo-dGTP pyrophosphatase MutT (NUDIX family)